MPARKVNARFATNAELWNLVRSRSPNFKSHTAEGTAELFTERGFATVKAAGFSTTFNEFWGIIMPYYLQLVNISHAKDRLEEADFGEYYENEWGEYSQRMAIDSIKPVTPAYRDLKDGPGPDQFAVRKPSAKDRFFRMNFDYQSWITLPDEWMTKRMFTSNYGFSEFLAGVYTGLENGYIVQKYVNKLACLNAAIQGDTDYPLQASQIASVSLSDEPTEAEIVGFILAIKNVISTMDTQAQTSAFNAYKFSSVQELSRLRLLVRTGFKNRVDLIAARNSYNRDVLNLPIPVIEVPDFGGLVPMSGEAQLYPVYDTNGTQIGWNTTEDATEVTVENGEETYADPNEDVVAVLADKGLIFETRQNPYQVEMVRNARGLYTNAWASAPNNGINFDPLYNMVVFKKTTTA